MKKKLIACLLAASLLLTGCGAGAPALSEGGTAGDGGESGEAAAVTLRLGGSEVSARARVLNDRLELWYSEPPQNPFAWLNYPETLTAEQREGAAVAFEDYNGDGSTDVRLTVEDAALCWTWMWGADGFVLAYPPTPADAAYVRRYRDVIAELHDSRRADRFALVSVDNDGVPELAAVSSEGAEDRKRVFLYTLDGGEPVLLASDVAPGPEGHFIAFFEKENIVLCCGAASGERREYLELEQGSAAPLLSLRWNYAPDGDASVIYLIDGSRVSEEQYHRAEADFTALHSRMVRLDLGEMTVVSLRFRNGTIEETVVGTVPYRSFEELTASADG